MTDDAGSAAPDALVDAPLAGAELVGTVVADRYHVERLLGAGAMGAVFRARHVLMHKPVALKVLHRNTSENPEVVTRFEREAVAAGRIAHPNVAGATDFGRLADGSFYLVLEFVDGKSLGQVIEEAGKLSVSRALAIAEQIAQALSAAHAADIVHRDLKPDNVMLIDATPASGPGGPGGQSALQTAWPGGTTELVKVLDFGLAKLAEHDVRDTKLTQMGAVYGTPQYMSPEQAAGEHVDARADLYALGVILHEMLAGQPPFQAEQMVPLLVMHMTEKPPALSEEIPRSVRAIVSKLLSKRPADRYQSADELLVQLRAELGPKPSQPSLPSLPQVSAEVFDRVGAVSKQVKRSLGPLMESAKEPITVRGVTVPRFVLAFAALALVFVGFSVALSLSGEATPEPPDEEEPAPTPSESRTGPSLDPKVRPVIDEAVRGADGALYALENRPEEERAVEEWMALAQAYAMRKKIPEALGAYGKAVELDPTMGHERAVLGPLRVLAEDEDFAKPILEFAKERLGREGADLLFYVWSHTSAKTTATKLAYELLDSGAMRAVYSPALAVALSLRAAEGCEAKKALLARVIEVGDERSLSQLKELSETRGCGSDKRADCYPCVRQGSALKDALLSASQRKAPRYELKRSFRFKK